MIVERPTFAEIDSMNNHSPMGTDWGPLGVNISKHTKIFARSEDVETEFDERQHQIHGTRRGLRKRDNI